MNRSALLLATVVVCGASLAVAQDQPIDSARLAAIARFRVGGGVRLSVHGDGRAEGTLVSTDGGAIILGRAGEERRVPGAAMDSAWVRGNAAGTGALVGGITGGLLLGGFAAALTSGFCENASGCDVAGPAAGGAAVGAVLGGVAGALVGVVIPKWHRRFP